MKKIKAFFITSLLGGTVVILPVAILIFLFKCIFDFITDIIQPLSNLVIVKSRLPEVSADMLVIVIIILACFIVGIFVGIEPQVN